MVGPSGSLEPMVQIVATLQASSSGVQLKHDADSILRMMLLTWNGGKNPGFVQRGMTRSLRDSHFLLDYCCDLPWQLSLGVARHPHCFAATRGGTPVTAGPRGKP